MLKRFQKSPLRAFWDSQMSINPINKTGKNCKTVYFWKTIRRVACVQSYSVSWILFESRVWETRLWAGKRIL